MRKNQLSVCLLTFLSVFVFAIGSRSQQKPAGKPSTALRGNSAVPARDATGVPPEESAAAEDRLTRLPVRRVVLYKNGIGYFTSG